MLPKFNFSVQMRVLRLDFLSMCLCKITFKKRKGLHSAFIGYFCLITLENVTFKKVICTPTYSSKTKYYTSIFKAVLLSGLINQAHSSAFMATYS